MKNKIIITSILLSTFSLYSNNSYIYNGINNIKFQKSNKSDEIIAPLPVEKNYLEAVCRIHATQIGSGYGNTYIGKLGFTLPDGSDFNFGSLLINGSLQGEFQNAFVNTSSRNSGTANNTAAYLVLNRWYSAQATNSSFSVTFKNPTDILNIKIQDRYLIQGQNYGGHSYNFNVYDCNNNIIASKKLSGFLSTANGVLANTNFKNLLSN